MNVIEKRRAVSYFRSKMEFTLGPAELNRMIREHADIMIVDVRAEEDYCKGHIPEAVSVPRDRWDSFTLGLKQNLQFIVYCTLVQDSTLT